MATAFVVEEAPRVPGKVNSGIKDSRPAKLKVKRHPQIEVKSRSLEARIAIVFPNEATVFAEGVTNRVRKTLGVCAVVSALPYAAAGQLKVGPRFDVILLIFEPSTTTLPTALVELASAPTKPAIIPIATDKAAAPPAPYGHLCAADPSTDQLEHRLAALVGMRLGGAQHQLFISYARSDGSVFARRMRTQLQTAGFKPYLDEIDDTLVPGDNIEAILFDRLKRCAGLVLIDTPDAYRSRWVDREIEYALGELIPIVPIRFEAIQPNDRRSSRFGMLGELDAGYVVVGDLDNDEAIRATSEVERRLGLVFGNLLKFPNRVADLMEEKGFDWKEEQKTIYRSRRTKHIRSRPIVEQILSQCSPSGTVDLVALRYFVNFILTSKNIANWRLHVYLGHILSDSDVKRRKAAIPESDATNLELLNLEELPHFLDEIFGGHT